MFQPMESGEADLRRPYSMYEHLILAPNHFLISAKCVQETRNQKKRDAMRIVSQNLNIVHSHLLFFRVQEIWANLLPRFTKNLFR